MFILIIILYYKEIIKQRISAWVNLLQLCQKRGRNGGEQGLTPVLPRLGGKIPDFNTHTHILAINCPTGGKKTPIGQAALAGGCRYYVKI